jgi:hypothetical protein
MQSKEHRSIIIVINIGIHIIRNPNTLRQPNPETNHCTQSKQPHQTGNVHTHYVVKKIVKSKNYKDGISVFGLKY